MCGISGFFSYKNKLDTKKYYKAHKKIAHRGPDDEGFAYKSKDGSIKLLSGDDTIAELKNRKLIYQQEPSSLILGHRRLSIIDLSADGHQPFEFENLYLTYNGEIYNYLELREELKELGYHFKTNSDTEVFLKAYHCWGISAFNRFNGMWASAIYDSKKDELLLIRDRFGIKPLYYTLKNDGILFGSEIKYISSFFDTLYANELRVYDYIRFNYLDHTQETLFKDIFQLEPGMYLKMTKNGIFKTKYWDLKDKEDINKDRLHDILKTSINLRLRSDVKVGSLLSGGIDSSTILGIINRYKLSKKFDTFSAVFNEKQYSEKEYIDDFKATSIKLQKHFIYPDTDRLIKSIDELIYTQEEPFRSLAVFSQNEIYRYIKINTNTKVLLNGQGADEIFTGYSEYNYIYLMQLLLSAKFRDFFREFNSFASNRDLRYHHLILNMIKTFFFKTFSKNDKYRLFTKKFKHIPTKKRFRSDLKDALWKSLTYSALREYLRYEDKNSMRYSLESRLPFLDINLVESAFSIEDSKKIYNGISKYILRDIVKDMIPKTVLNRKDKMGFISPQELWQKTLLSDEFDKIFLEIGKNGLFDFISTKNVIKLYNNYKDNNMHDWTIIWRLYLLFKWKKVWQVT